MNALEKYAAKRVLVSRLSEEMEKKAVWGLVAKGLKGAAGMAARGSRVGIKTKRYRYDPTPKQPYGSRTGKQYFTDKATGKFKEHGGVRGALRKGLLATSRGLNRMASKATGHKYTKQYERASRTSNPDARWHFQRGADQRRAADPFSPENYMKGVGSRLAA
jgi:hypothetical protein